MVTRPRTTFAELVKRPAWVTTWIFILISWAVCGAGLLSTDVGQQTLVDERVRVVETFGGVVSDDLYNALQARPPWWVYLTSGGRVLLTPPITVLTAVALLVVARAGGTRATMAQVLAIVVHASVVLLIGQVIATPLHYVRESLTSPFNLATILPMMQEGSLQQRFFGTLDLFGLWWAGLLALGLAVLTSRPVTRYAWPMVMVFFGFAAVVAAVIAAAGGA